MKTHIHTADDGRGLRRVLLDGVEVKGCVYADTRRGVVVLMREPLAIRKRDGHLITLRRRGRVEVLPYD